MTEPPAPETADGATALSHLHRNLYRMADAAAPQDGSVELVLVQDPAAEAEEAAAACLRWAADGLTFADMAVVCPSEGPQAGLVTAALDRGGIPWVRHHPLPLVSTAPGRGALLLALLASGPLCGQVFFDFLATADVADAIRSEFAPFDPDRWARLARRCGLDSSDAVEAAAWESRLAALVSDLAAGSGDPDPADVSAAESLRRIVSALAADLSPPEETTWAAHTSWFDDLVRRYLAEPDAVAVALAPLSTMDEVGPLDSTEAFVSQVRLTIESSPSAPPPPAALARTGVSVLGVQDVGLAAYEAVCLLGAADGYLPRPAARAVLLDDAERRKLNEVLSADLPLAATAHASDPLDFAAAVWAARSRLLVVRPRTTISGAPLAPSPYFRAALIALKGDVIDVSACDHDALVRHGHLTEVAWAVDEAAAAAALVADAGTTCLSAGAARGRVAWLSRRRGNELTAYEGLVDPATVEALPEALNPLGGALSPTRLETYAGCPFRYLAENVLGLHGAPARDDMDSRHRGSLVHEILERFLDAATAEPEQSEEDETELLDRTAGEVLEAWENRGRTPTAAAWKVTRSQILADLRRWWEIEREAADSGWRPQLLEAPFGRPDAGAGAEHAPLVLETDSGPMSFGGRIDRVDVNAEGDAFRVVDYKTGAVGKAADGPDGGRSLQLPLYLRAAAQMLELPLQAGSAQYFYVTRRGGFLRRQSWADEAALTRLLSSLRASLAAGDFHPEPGPACTTAGGCEFRSVCGRQVESVMHTRRRDRRHTDYTDRFETIREAVTGGAS